MPSTGTKVSARSKAREKLAAAREAQRQREALAEQNLATLLSADDVIAKARRTQQRAIDAAQASYDAAVAAAGKVFESATAAARAEQAAAAAAMKDAGETIATIAELADLSPREVSALIREHTDGRPAAGDDTTSSDDPASGTPGNAIDPDGDSQESESAAADDSAPSPTPGDDTGDVSDDAGQREWAGATA
ncbi:hypothetical protein [Williamsia serinedens]|uniref:Uncharacterized protein n=1 Tax=Williamsia serinedens TaxID=391736 RepID=A0ABT1H816_9NOCA|nr:hypothetical protein [Williamsia serinedens]MCP2163059.1 hypothetical protein [Williamsia serinedens]